MRKVFGSPIKLDVSARSAAARERSAYNNYTWSKSGNKYVKTFAKPKNVKRASGSWTGSLPRRRLSSAMTLNCHVKRAQPPKTTSPPGGEFPGARNFWGRRRKSSKAEAEVEAILKKISKIRKEADLMLAQPVKAAVKLRKSSWILSLSRA